MKLLPRKQFCTQVDYLLKSFALIFSLSDYRKDKQKDVETTSTSHLHEKSTRNKVYLELLLISLIFNVETSMKFGQVKPSLNRLIKNG